MKLLVNGVNVTSLLVADDPSAVNFSDDINAHGVLVLRLEDFAGTFAPAFGQSIQMYSPDDATLAFAGSIDSVVMDVEPVYCGKRTFALTSIDFNKVPSRFTAAELYTNVTCGAIIRDLITKYLSADGISDAGVEDGPTLASYVVPYIPVLEAFVDLCKLSGYGLTIDPSGGAYFTDRTSIVAPFVLDDTTVKCIKLRVIQSRDQYRNRQYVGGGTDVTDARTESFVGDGTRRTFTTQFPVSAVPTVTVNGVPKTVGIGSIDTGKDFYWNESSSQISQDAGGTPLTDLETLAVTYRGLYPPLALVQDDAAIAARVAIEGGSGFYDNRTDQPALNTAVMATTMASALIARFNASAQLVLTFTQLNGLRAGQLLTVNRTDIGIAGEYLITSIVGQCEYLDNADAWTYQVTATEGTAVGGWTEYFTKLAASTRSNLQSANQVLQLLRTQTEAVTLGDSLVASTSAPESRIGTMRIGFGEIAA